MVAASGAFAAWPVALWALLALAAGVGAGLYATAPDGNVIAYALHFLRVKAQNAHDSWKPMILAIDRLRDDPGASVYRELFFGGIIKFQYPLSSLVVPDLVQRLTGLPWNRMTSLLNWTSWYLVWLTGFAVWRLLAGSIRRAASGSAPSADDELRLLWPVLGLTVLFYPLSKSYALGQVQTALTFFGTLALLLWQSGRKGMAGLLIGLCCAVKPHWAVLILWGALRREWTMAGMAAVSFAALTLAAGALYGFHHYREYLSVLSFLSQHGEAFFPNQSMNGLLNRLFFTDSNLTFDVHGFPAFDLRVYAGTLAASVLILGAALLFRRRERPGALDLALIMLATTVASPIAWEHHYGILPAIFAVAAPAALSRKPFGAWTVPYLLLAWLVASQRLDLANRLADTPFNVLQSYLFFAGLAVLLLLFRLAAAERPACMAAEPAAPQARGAD